jgi:hypothetical protein
MALPKGVAILARATSVGSARTRYVEGKGEVVNDSTNVWIGFLRELDTEMLRRARKKWEAATEEERRAIAWEAFVNSLLNHP